MKKAAPALPEKAPEVYRVKFDTTKGVFVVEVSKAWAPHGAEHFYTLARSRYYDGVPFYRVVRNFVARFGISFDTAAANLLLDKSGFAPIGRVVEGMEVVEQFYSSYGEMAPRGNGPDPKRIEREGKGYLERAFPRLDYIKRAVIVP